MFDSIEEPVRFHPGRFFAGQSPACGTADTPHSNSGLHALSLRFFGLSQSRLRSYGVHEKPLQQTMWGGPPNGCQRGAMSTMDKKTGILAVVAVAGGALVSTANVAAAGGFALREQSAQYQGLSFAGSASGGALSSMFWNPAATAILPGLNTESAYTLIIPQAEVIVQSTSKELDGFPRRSDIADIAFNGASYAAYQLTGLDPNLFVGVALNSPFGISTEPDNPRYAGAVLARTSDLQTYNLNPNVAYRVAPGLIVGAGLQVQYADVRLKYAAETPNDPNSFFRGDDVAFGATAGILYQPSAGTSIGLGWRSQMTHTLDGDAGVVGVGKGSAKAELKLPDIVTLSLTQAVAPDVRLMGTVEWTNWSRFRELRVDSAGPDLVVHTNWDDGWFFALGAEYDYSPLLTLRAGVAYEISPADSPDQLLVAVPDADRIWLSAGAAYKWSDSVTVNLAYSHVFIDDGDFDRTATANLNRVAGEIESSADIISVGLKMNWGGALPLK